MSDTIDRAKLGAAINFLRTYNGKASQWNTVLAAAEAHLATLPRTKMVNTWRVEFAERQPSDDWLPGSHTFTSKEQADEYEASLKALRPSLRCIRVTGPHSHEVPQ